MADGGHGSPRASSLPWPSVADLSWGCGDDGRSHYPCGLRSRSGVGPCPVGSDTFGAQIAHHLRYFQYQTTDYAPHSPALRCADEHHDDVHDISRVPVRGAHHDHHIPAL